MGRVHVPGVVVLCCAGLFAATAAAQEVEGIGSSPVQQALEAAKQSGKPILTMIGSET